MLDKIVVHGARANNLKNIDVELPRDKLVVMTGLSGSGKSSLAFDTISAGIWRASPPMHGSFWDRWRNRMWTASKDSRRQSPSTRKPHPRIPAPLWER